MPRTRINISIDPALHSTAKTHARQAHDTDFSGLVTKLIIADLGGAYTAKKLHLDAKKVAALEERIAQDEADRLKHGPRAEKTSGIPAATIRARKAQKAKEAADRARLEVDESRRKPATARVH